MEELNEFLRLAQLVVFVGLGVTAFVQWGRRRDRAAGWLAATFGVLAYVVLMGRLIPDDPSGAVLQLLSKSVLAVLVLFPYFLYRFAGSFRPTPRWVDVAAAGMTGVIAALGSVLPESPDGEARPPIYMAFILLLLVHWSSLSAIVSARLWQGGRGQPTVARRRMRTLSLGAIGLAIALVLVIAPNSEGVSAFQIASQLLALGSALLFLLGFAPPGFVRTAWRKPEERALREAELGLMEAVTDRDIAGPLLPHVSRLVGGRGAIITGAGEELVGSHGLTRPEAEALASRVAGSARTDERTEILAVPVRAGFLAVEASTYTPFFGREETEMLERLAVLAGLAFERADLFRRERHGQQQLLEAQRLAKLGSWEWDTATGEMRWSEEMYQIFGYDKDSAPPAQDDYLARVHSDDRKRVAAALQRTVEENEPFAYEHRIVKPGGEIAYVYSRGAFVAEGEGIGPKMVGTAQDITDRRRQELFREQFIANAAHELRTPMTTLVGFVEMLSRRRRSLSEPQLQTMVDAMSRSGERLAVLINNLLDLTKLQQGELHLELAPVELTEVSKAALESAPPHPERTWR